MTGAYVRIQRDGRWQSLEITELTDEELESLFDPSDYKLAASPASWAVFLAKWIRDNVIDAPEAVVRALENAMNAENEDAVE